jgi:hypothetical protein
MKKLYICVLGALLLASNGMTRVSKEFDDTGNYQVDRMFGLLFDKINDISLGRADSDTKVGDMDAVYVRYTSNASANTQDQISHNLGRKPEGYIVVYQNKSASVYDSGTTWNSKFIYLKCSTATTILRLIIF